MRKGYLLGSHNTLSYMKPLDWWTAPFRCFAKCQSLSYEEQYERGVRVYDFRLRKCNGDWYVTHGIMRFCGIRELKHALLFLNRMANDRDPVYVRFLLEYNREPKGAEILTAEFIDMVSHFIYIYKNLNFFGVRCKWNWSELYSTDMDIDDQYSSVRGSNPISKLFPHLWAKRHNKEVLEKGTDRCCLMMDFI